MNDPFENVDWGKLATSFEKMARDINTAIENIGQAIIRAYQPVIMAFNQLPRMPGEHPVDYVLRRGSASGHFIYPGEAWRFRANLDWWSGDDCPDEWGSGWKDKR